MRLNYTTSSHRFKKKDRTLISNDINQVANEKLFCLQKTIVCHRLLRFYMLLLY